MKRFRSPGMLGDAVPKGRARRRRQGGARADPVRALKCAPRTSKAITHFTTNRCNPSRALQTGRPLHFPNPNFAPIHITRPPKLYSGYAAITVLRGWIYLYGSSFAKPNLLHHSRKADTSSMSTVPVYPFGLSRFCIVAEVSPLLP